MYFSFEISESIIGLNRDVTMESLCSIEHMNIDSNDGIISQPFINSQPNVSRIIIEKIRPKNTIENLNLKKDKSIIIYLLCLKFTSIQI